MNRYVCNAYTCKVSERGRVSRVGRGVQRTIGLEERKAGIDVG